MEALPALRHDHHRRERLLRQLGRALATKETSISIPCFAERRYGGVQDDELLLAMPPDEFARGIEGLEGIGRVGLRYPIPPYGSQMDPSLGMEVGEPRKR